jgi:hypothetical protein
MPLTAAGIYSAHPGVPPLVLLVRHHREYG